jgi:uncharacterized membrane protein YoaK (UPF0700 family)
MLTKPIPAWILGGGAMLAASAGCINVVGFLGAQHQAISHLTGTVSMFSMEIAQSNWALTAHAGAVFGAFFIGCILSGLIIRHPALQSGPPYGAALTLESLLLATAVYFLRHQIV